MAEYIRIKVDGVVKSITADATAEELYRVAGGKVYGVTPDKDGMVHLTMDQEFTSEALGGHDPVTGQEPKPRDNANQLPPDPPAAKPAEAGMAISESGNVRSDGTTVGKPIAGTTDKPGATSSTKV